MAYKLSPSLACGDINAREQCRSEPESKRNQRNEERKVSEMAYEFLKKLFGTPKDGEEPKTMTYAELEAAIDADKKIQVVDVKAGGYVSKEKLDAKITELDGVKQQLSDANTTIQSYKDMDIDGIKQSAKDWETKYTQETQKLTAQLAAQERTHALDMFMGGYKFSSKPAENGVRAEFEKKTESSWEAMSL